MKRCFSNLSLKDLDVIIAILCIFIGIIFFVLGLFISGSSMFSSIRLPLVALLLSFSGAIYLKMRRKWLEVPVQFVISDPNSYANKSMFYAILISFFVLFAYSLFTLKTALYIRPLGYFVATIVMCGIIATQIYMLPASNKNYIWVILAEIFMIGISLRASIYYEFPGFIGVDPWWHAYFTNKIVTLGHVPSNEFYSHFPIYHIFAAETSVLTGLNIKSSLMMSTGIFEIIGLAFVFLIGQQYFNSKIGLLSALMLSINAYHIHWSYWIIPMTLGIGLAIFIFYIKIKSNQHNPKSEKIYTSLSLFILMILIMSHSASTTIALVILSLLYVGNLIYNFVQRDKTFVNQISLAFLMLFSVCMFAYWIYVSEIFLQTTIIRGIREVNMMDEEIVKCLPTQLAESVMDLTGFILFYLLALIGSLNILNRNLQNKERFALIVAVWFLAAFVFIMPIVLGGALVPKRWPVFLEMILCIPAATGLLLICHHDDVRKGVISIFLIVLVLSASILTNSNVNPDGAIQDIKSHNVRYGLTQSEIQATQTVSGKYAGTIGTDQFLVFPGAFIAHGSFADISEMLIAEDYEGIPTDIILIRDYIIENPFLSDVAVELRDDPREDLDKLEYNRIYDSSTVYGYHKKSQKGID